MANRDQLIQQFNDFADLMARQDTITGQLLDLFTEYRRNQQESYLLLQRLRGFIFSLPGNDDIKVNQLYITDIHGLLTFDESIVNPPSDLEGYHLKFGERYNDLIGGQKLYRFHKLVYVASGIIDKFSISDFNLPFINYDFEGEDDSLISEMDIAINVHGVEMRLTIKADIDKDLRTVRYFAECPDPSVTFIGFTLCI